MLRLLAFILGLSVTLLIALPLGEPSTWDSYVRRQAIPQPAAQAFAVASTVICIAALTTAIAGLLVPVVTKVRKDLWPTKATILGIVVGLCVSATLDGMCIRAMRQASLPPQHSPPSFIFCVVVLTAAFVGMGFLVFLSVSARQIARLPPGGFTQQNLQELF